MSGIVEPPAAAFVEAAGADPSRNKTNLPSSFLAIRPGVALANAFISDSTNAAGSFVRLDSFSTESPPCNRSSFASSIAWRARWRFSASSSGSNSSVMLLASGGPVTVHPPASFGSTSTTQRPALRSASACASVVKPLVLISTSVCGTPPRLGGRVPSNF